MSVTGGRRVDVGGRNPSRQTEGDCGGGRSEVPVPSPGADVSVTVDRLTQSGVWGGLRSRRTGPLVTFLSRQGWNSDCVWSGPRQDSSSFIHVPKWEKGDRHISRWTPGHTRISGWTPGHRCISRWTPGYTRISRWTPGHGCISRWTPGHTRISRWTPGHRCISRWTPRSHTHLEVDSRSQTHLEVDSRSHTNHGCRLNRVRAPVRVSTCTGVFSDSCLGLPYVEYCT